MGEEVADQVAAHPHAGEDADRAGPGPGVIARVLQSLPAALEKEPVLRIHQLRLARAEVEEVGVEMLHVAQGGARPDVARVVEQRRGDSRGGQLLAGVEADRFDSAAQVAPELPQVVGAGETSGHADDGDPFEGAALRILLTHLVLPSPDLTVRGFLCWLARRRRSSSTACRWRSRVPPSPAGRTAARPRPGAGRCGRLAAPGFQGLGKAPDGRVAEHLHDRDLAVERLAQPRLDLDEQQGAPAQLEEVVVDTDAFVPEHVLPDRGERLLVRRPRRGVGAVQAQPAGVRRRQGLAVDLAIPVERQGGERDEGGGDHGLRQPLGQEPPQLARGGPAGRGARHRDQVGDQLPASRRIVAGRRRRSAPPPDARAAPPRSRRAPCALRAP